MRAKTALGSLVLLAAGCSEGPATPPDPPLDPGRVTIHRLNRAEYDNTVRDLLGTSLRPAADFLTDDYGYGFDNIGDVLSLSPTQFELYEQAAEALAHDVVAVGAEPATQLFEGETLTSPVGAAVADAWLLWSDGELTTNVALPEAGTYTISARVWADQAGPDLARATLYAGGVALGSFDVPALAGDPMVIQATGDLAAGAVVVSVSFDNDFWDQATNADRNLYVDWIAVDGPVGGQATNPLRDKLFPCDPAEDACLRSSLEDLARRAFRRPVDGPEVDALIALVDLAEAQGGTLDEGLETAVKGVLLSPHFLFRPEIDPPGGAEPHPVGPYELASRLSYFLWSSMPDEELFDAAASGALDDAAGVRAQAERMLADPKARALVDNFAGQWLLTRALADHQPDYLAFPGFDESLRAAMQEETRLFFGEVLDQELPIQELLTADWTFVNDRLALHYGLPPPGPSFTKVDLSGEPPETARGGLLRQGSILTLTSYPTRTSPVRRGKWVLSNLLCSEPKPPPPGVEGFKPGELETGTIREKLEAHRQDPTCAACHETMDNLGFGLERFDGIGTFRDLEHGQPIDDTGALSDGTPFAGAGELADALSGDARFTRCVVKKMLTYALGRGVEGDVDEAHVSHLRDLAVADGETLRAVILAIVESEPFRLRTPEVTP